MKKLLLVVAVLSFGFSHAQVEFDRCATHDALLLQEETNPGYMAQINEVFERCKAMQNAGDRSDVYTIPVVVHILYENDDENLHDSVIFNQIASLNDDYRRWNADTINLRDTFNTIVGDSYIEFELAQWDPTGNPTDGIVRVATTNTSFFGVGTLPAEGIKDATQGGSDPWDQDNYLNIWVGDLSIFGFVSLLGYATPPDGLPNWPPGSTTGLSDGVVVHYEAFGSNNPNDLDLGGGPVNVLGRTATHEVGHYLGLRHIWADGDCTEEDGIDDTPNADAESNQDCDDTKNTCVDAIGTLGDLPDMIENYMDYSSEDCQNSFTTGQVDFMRSVLENERIDLIDGYPVVGITEVEKESFTVFPNPSNGEITLTDLSAGANQVEIYNNTGQLVKSISLNSSTITIDGLSEGVYTIAVTTDNSVSTERLIVIN